nr:uncharacterized protein I203_00131 [Kwoniella mangroviensis CBS 8507]OCF70002.1 hypothetical protein I203_00131 [Kwoniella mangroviensis CBS 8507]
MPSGKNNGMGKAWANLDQSGKWSTKGIGAILKVEDAIAYRHYKVFRALRKKLNNKGGEYPTTFSDWWCRINSIDGDVAACAKEQFESIVLNHDRYPQMIKTLSDREIRKMVERKRTSTFHTYKPTDELFNFPKNLVDNDGNALAFIRLRHMPSIPKHRLPRQEIDDESPNYSHDEWRSSSIFGVV